MSNLCNHPELFFHEPIHHFFYKYTPFYVYQNKREDLDSNSNELNLKELKSDYTPLNYTQKNTTDSIKVLLEIKRK